MMIKTLKTLVMLACPFSGMQGPQLYLLLAMMCAGLDKGFGGGETGCDDMGCFAWKEVGGQQHHLCVASARRKMTGLAL